MSGTPSDDNKEEEKNDTSKNMRNSSRRINISFVQRSSDSPRVESNVEDDCRTDGQLSKANGNHVGSAPSWANCSISRARRSPSISYRTLSDRVVSRIVSTLPAEWDITGTDADKAGGNAVKKTEMDNKHEDEGKKRNIIKLVTSSSSNSLRVDPNVFGPHQGNLTSSATEISKHINSSADTAGGHSVTILNNEMCPIEDVRHAYVDDSSKYIQGLDLDRVVFYVDDAPFEPLIIQSDDYCVESSVHSSCLPVTLRSLLEDKNFYLSPDYRSEMWYTRYFMNQSHTSYLGLDNSRQCFVISTMVQTDPDSQRKFFHLLLQTSKYSNHRRIEESYLKKNNTWFKKSSYNIVAAMKLMIPTFAYTKVWMVKDPELSQDISALESCRRCTTYKFGVLLCKEGQTQEEEMFSNVQSTELFDNFLTLLGKHVRLNGFQFYLGGLDGTYDSTGTHSVYTKWRDNEIMFHVSTMLPFCSDNNQQLERKRHLGNDIVLIVFNEGNEPISTDAVSSNFIHVVIVVRPVKIKGKIVYRLAVSSKKELLPFVPIFPQNAIFEHSPEFREAFLSKLINAEWASYNAKTLLSKFQRTRQLMLREIEEKYKP